MLTGRPRICVITLIRIKITTSNHGSNAQYVYSLVALFTCLEVLLGVLNACLPVMKPIFTKLASYKGSSWLSSVMSGSIPVFMRPSQMSTNWKSNPARNSAMRYSTVTRPFSKEMPLVRRWPSFSAHPNGNDAQIKGKNQNAPQRYVDSKAANICFAPSTDYAGPPKSARPLISPKSKYNSGVRWGKPVEEGDGEDAKGIYVQREWDVERGESVETDRQGLVKTTGRW